MITSSLGFEECTHKLLKLNLREGQEVRERGESEA